MPEIILPDSEDLEAAIQFDTKNGKVWLNEQRVTLMSLLALSKFRSDLINTLGMERTKGLFMRLGYYMGKLDAEFAQDQRKDKSIEEQFMSGPQLHSLRGMVKAIPVELEVNIEKGHLHCIVDWHDSYEVSITQSEIGQLSEPGCWCLTGYASGYSTTFMQKPFFFQEIECCSTGDKRCRAIVKPAEEWDNYHQFKKYFEDDSILYEIEKLKLTVQVLRRTVHEKYGLNDVIGNSKSFREALDLTRKVADKEINVLLLGETGVGKDILASSLHKFSSRADQPYIAVNCAAIPPELIEGELFGTLKGAYSGVTRTRQGCFEKADKGTIFLDEVGELSPRAQAVLLRVLQEGKFERVGDKKTRVVDVRVVAATNANLEKAIKEGRFRADLYYRLAAYPITAPPLRERIEDIPNFVDYFINKYQAIHNTNVTGISDKAMQVLQQYHWPGNVRELENIIQRALVLTEPGHSIGVDEIFPNTPNIEQDKADNTLELTADGSLHESPSASETKRDLVEQVLDSNLGIEYYEREIISRALKRTNGNISKAARMVGLSRATMAYRINKLNKEEE